ncbi:MAG: Fe-S-containing hydro-lyase [Eubacteriales bacterium]|nr:Fe-S-containing hydro-lyase [Eubacteriales bacterium]
MQNIKIQTPLSKEILQSLRAGDSVLLSGTIYTARDAAHARFRTALQNGEELPVDLRGQIVYYAGPSPTPPQKVVGAIGPTTSARMDQFTPMMLEYGLCATIGKGNRNEETMRAIVEHGSVYFAALGGGAALGAMCVKELEVVAYDDLGPESVKRLVVEDLPLVVAVDCQGNDLYTIGRQTYLESLNEK